MTDYHQNPAYTPARLGYRMPAEWEKHEATWLAWPHNEETWPDFRLEKVRHVYLQMIEALLPHEKVQLLVRDDAEADQVLKILRERKVSLKNLLLKKAATVDAWIRDYGPTFLKNQDDEKAWCKWVFNAWGGKYSDLMMDNQVFIRHASWIQAPCFDAGFILEGGSIEVNGRGVCLTTEQCLLHPNRNGHLSRTQVEELLRQYLGCTEVVWLKQGIEGDDTDGHIDDFARFVNETTLVMAWEEDARSANGQLLRANWEALEFYVREHGKQWQLIRLPMPAAISDGEGGVLPASYANFYIANQVVLVPVFGDSHDSLALAVLKDCFPGRTLVPIECSDLVYGMGAIHCVTQQQPA